MRILVFTNLPIFFINQKFIILNKSSSLLALFCIPIYYFLTIKNRFINESIYKKNFSNHITRFKKIKKKTKKKDGFFIDRIKYKDKEYLITTEIRASLFHSILFHIIRVCDFYLFYDL